MMAPTKMASALMGERTESAPPLFNLARYRHYKGGLYTLLCVARCEWKPEISHAVYMAEGTCEIWTRPLDEFAGKVKLPDGTKVPRFEKVTT